MKKEVHFYCISSKQISFVSWMGYAVPPSLLLTIVYWLFLYWMFRPHVKNERRKAECLIFFFFVSVSVCLSILKQSFRPCDGRITLFWGERSCILCFFFLLIAFRKCCDADDHWLVHVSVDGISHWKSWHHQCVPHRLLLRLGNFDQV